MLHGLISEATCILTFYNGLVSEASYISVLKIRVHKQCHVNKFSTATSTCMLWTHRHVQSPSHTEGCALKGSLLAFAAPHTPFLALARN